VRTDTKSKICTMASSCVRRSQHLCCSEHPLRTGSMTGRAEELGLSFFLGQLKVSFVFNVPHKSFLQHLPFVYLHVNILHVVQEQGVSATQEPQAILVARLHPFCNIEYELRGQTVYVRGTGVPDLDRLCELVGLLSALHCWRPAVVLVLYQESG